MLALAIEEQDGERGRRGGGGSDEEEEDRRGCRLHRSRSCCRRWCSCMYATCASETSSCRLLLLRGGAEAEAEAVVGAEAERENKERRRKMRVTELNIVRIDRCWIWSRLVGIWGSSENRNEVGWDIGISFFFFFFVAVGLSGIFDEGDDYEVEVFM